MTWKNDCENVRTGKALVPFKCTGPSQFVSALFNSLRTNDLEYRGGPSLFVKRSDTDWGMRATRIPEHQSI